MLSLETEARIAKILLILAENEKSIEICRQLLREDKDFDSYQIFRYLDIGSKNKIDSYDIIHFLRKRRIKVNELEVNFFILSYDEGSNNYLSYIEFLNFLQCDNSFKKNNFSKNETISQSIEFELGKLLEKEILLSRNLFPLLNDLKTRLDYNIHNFYHSIKKMNNITFDCIKKFLEKNYVNFSNIDIKNIIKRLDFNKDGRIDLCEFHKFFGFPEFSKLCPSKLCCICGCCNCCCEGPCCKNNCENDILENEYFDNQNSNCNKNENYNFKNEENDINNKSNNTFDNNNEKNNNNNNNQINNINLNNNDINYNENKSNLDNKNNENFNSSNKDLNKGNNNKNNSIIGKYSKILLPEIIYQSIKKNKKPIEEIKNNSFKNEYNNNYKITNLTTNQTPERNFNFQNSINSSPLTKSQLINSTNQNNNINLKNNNNNDTEENINKNSNNNNINITDINNINIKNKQNLIEENQMKEYLIELMIIESKIEEEKIELVSKCDFNIEDAFKIFDIYNKGYLIDDDLKFTLNQFGIFVNDYDIRLLMKRFDLNKKCCLNFTDFFDMIVPFEKHYRTLIENRDSNIFSNNYSNYDIFMFSTKNLLKNLFTDLIEYENKLNNIKRNFTTLRLKLKDLFNLIDTNLSNEFNFDDLEKYLKKNHILNNLKDANLLFIRFDKNRDGKIDYCEFEEEFLPQF